MASDHVEVDHLVYLDAEALARLLMGGRDEMGLFERVLGFRTSTTRFFLMHLMNDLAQSVFGGHPTHRGDLLCRLVRYEHVGEEGGEDNRDAVLRADERLGGAYNAAFPETIGAAQVRELREGIAALLNFDKGMYLPGTAMASPVATHWRLLGREGYRRFKAGLYVSELIGPEGRELLHELYRRERDPVSRALAPLLFGHELEAQTYERAQVERTAFDQALSRRMSNLLRQPLSKPVLLRYLALASSLALTLKLYGLGRAGGIPTLLALPAESSTEGRALREQAVVSLARGLDAFDRHLAGALVQEPEWAHILCNQIRSGAWPTLTIDASLQGVDAAHEAIRALRAHRTGSIKGVKETDMYWPENFVNSMAQRAGVVGPKTNRAGWGKHLTLTPDLVEVVILMFTDPGGAPKPWLQLWAEVAADLGILIGANQDLDAHTLEDAQVPFVSLSELETNSEIFLEYAIERGIARRLPDSGAEVGGALL